MKNVTLLLPAILLGAAPLASAQIAYGTDDASAADNHFFDENTGTNTSGLWTDADTWALADDDVSGVMYIGDGSTLKAWPYNDPNPAVTVGTINDGGRTLVPIGLGYDNGMLLGYDNDTLGLEGFWDIDVVTGNSTLFFAVASTTGDFGGVDIDPATGLIYCSNDTATYTDTMGNTGRGIVTVDPVTGAETIVGPYPGAVTDIDGLAFDPAGIVWMLEDNPAPLHNFDLATMMYDPAPPMNAILASEVFSGGSYTAGFTPGGGFGTAYCMANPNSTGATGTISGAGSTMAASNDVTLTAADLPNSAFGFFITSTTQGFVANPAGSEGNLCLAGAIGRYVGAGQIQNTGGAGSFSLALDLTQTPTPTGLVSIAAGETWNFQAWHRDANMGTPVSNFTDGLSITFN
ncbi:hypothetical protein Poly30_47500 [Planctomycetes bacterium Poly30]|uniref:SMP-30/Gluconolaconase/LRE-like region n=1 Tax=Saltatorellus ferox TaxID=2528018 RepID=A0A518EYP1_9BACT|nr:hypothetical protein Poly30_47500 [Planctomycetes bacterium Poly30]